MHVVETVIEVGHEELLARVDGDDVVFVDAIAEAQCDRLLRDGPWLLSEPRGNDDEDVCEAIVFAGDEEAGGDGTAVFGGAPGVHGDEAFLGARSEKDGASRHARVFQLKFVIKLAIGDCNRHLAVDCCNGNGLVCVKMIIGRRCCLVDRGYIMDREIIGSGRRMCRRILNARESGERLVGARGCG